jgi:hypothetical protein
MENHIRGNISDCFHKSLNVSTLQNFNVNNNLVIQVRLYLQLTEREQDRGGATFAERSRNRIE